MNIVNVYISAATALIGIVTILARNFRANQKILHTVFFALPVFALLAQLTFLVFYQSSTSENLKSNLAFTHLISTLAILVLTGYYSFKDQQSHKIRRALKIFSVLMVSVPMVFSIAGIFLIAIEFFGRSNDFLLDDESILNALTWVVTNILIAIAINIFSGLLTERIKF